MESEFSLVYCLLGNSKGSSNLFKIQSFVLNSSSNISDLISVSNEQLSFISNICL